MEADWHKTLMVFIKLLLQWLKRSVGRQDGARKSDLMAAATGTSCKCTDPLTIKHTSYGFLRVCLRHVCVSNGILSSHGSPSYHFTEKFVISMATPGYRGYSKFVCLCMCVSGGRQARERGERVIEWKVHYHGQLYWIKMADGGWEHIRGAYIIQHLIEGAGWKKCRGESK